MEGPPKKEAPQVPKFQRFADEPDYVPPPLSEDDSLGNLEQLPEHSSTEIVESDSAVSGQSGNSIVEKVSDGSKRELGSLLSQLKKLGRVAPPLTDLPIPKSGESKPSEGKPQKAKATRTVKPRASASRLNLNPSKENFKPEVSTPEQSKANTPIKEGMRVQWESQGALQLEGFKSITRVSEDGKWVWVEGSDTGIPADQIIPEGERKVSKSKVENASSNESKESNDQGEPTQSPEGSAVNESVKEAKTEPAVMDEKSTMEAAEKKYLDAYKQFYSKKGVLDQVSQFRHEIFGHKVGGMKEVDQLKTEYDKARLAYGKKLDDSAFERVGERLGLHKVRDVYRVNGATGEIINGPDGKAHRGKRVKREEKEREEIEGVRWRSYEERHRKRYENLKEAGKMRKAELPDGKWQYYKKGKEPSFEEYFKEYRSKEHADKVMERYKRYVRFKEVVKPGAEKAYQARVEALDERGKNVVEKSLGWVAKQNKALEEKYGKKGARAIRALCPLLVPVGLAVCSVSDGGVVGVIRRATMTFDDGPSNRRLVAARSSRSSADADHRPKTLTASDKPGQEVPVSFEHTERELPTCVDHIRQQATRWSQLDR